MNVAHLAKLLAKVGRMSGVQPIHVCARSLPTLALLLLVAISTPASRLSGRIVRLVPDDEEPRVLALGQVIASQLQPGQKHRYRLAVADTGDFFRLYLHAVDLKLRMVIYDPVGQSVRESGSQTFGPTSLSWIAASKGGHLIEVGAPAGDGGVYEIRLEENRPQESRDVIRVNAEQALNEAERLCDRRNERQAIEKYGQALSDWRALEDPRAVGGTLMAIGWAFGQLSEEEEARGYFNQAITVWRALNDNAGLAEAEFGLAYMNVNLGDVVAGREGYARAAELWRALNNPKRQAQNLIPLAVLHVQLGEGQYAIDLYRQALGLFHQLTSQRGEAMALNGLGWAYYELGDDQSAIDTSNQSLQIAERLKSNTIQEQTHTTIGQAYARLGELQPALDHASRALAISRAIDDRLQQAVSLKEIGAVYEKLSDRQQALNYYTQALALARELKYRQGEAEALNCVGHLHELNGDRQQALASYLAALPICRDTRNRVEEISTLHHLARVLRDLGSLDQARVQIKSAIELIESCRAHAGSRRMRESYFATVQKSYELYIDVLMQLHKQRPAEGLDRIALQLSEQARARSLSEMLTEAQADLRRDAPPELFAREHELQQLLRAKAEVQTQLLEASNTRPQAEAIAKELRKLNLEYDEVQHKIREAAPGYVAITQPHALSCNDIQQMVLDGQTALLEYALGDERSYGWLVTRDKVVSFALPPRKVIEGAARSVYDLLTVRQPRPKETSAEYLTRLNKARAEKVDEQFWREAESLSRMIIGPVVADITQPRLLVVSDGALQYLPFSALPDPLFSAPAPDRAAGKKQSANLRDEPPPPLLVKYEVINLPSATTLAVLRREMAGRHPASKSIAIVADPVFSSDDPPPQHNESGRQPNQDRRGSIAIRRPADARNRREHFALDLFWEGS